VHKPTPEEFPSRDAYMVAWTAYWKAHDKLQKDLAKELSKALTKDRGPLRLAVKRANESVKELTEALQAGHFNEVRKAALAQLLAAAVTRRDQRIQILERFDLKNGRARPAPKAQPPSPAYGIPPERKAQLRAQYPHIKFYDEYNT